MAMQAKIVNKLLVHTMSCIQLQHMYAYGVCDRVEVGLSQIIAS